MNTLPRSFGILIIIAQCLVAERLPLLKVKDWGSYHVLSKSSHHAVGVGVDGSIDLYFLKRGRKDNINWPVEMKVRIERKDKATKGKSSKWVSKTVTKSGFVSPAKAAENPDELSLVGVVTGGIKFQLDFKFTKSGVMLAGKLLDNPQDADYRVILESDIDKLSTVTSSEGKDTKTVKKKTRGDEIRFETRNKTSLKVKFYEVIDPVILGKAEITLVELKAKKIGRKKLTWSLVDEKLGQLNILSKADNGMPYAGFTITSVLYDETGKHHSDGVLLEYK